MARKEHSLDESAGPSVAVSGMPAWWTRYPQTLPPEYYAAIGEICARWSWLEFQLGVIVRETLRLSKPAGFAVTGGMSMRSVSTVLKALSIGDLPKGHPELRKEIGALGKKLYDIGDLRNEYVHSLWGYEDQANTQLGIFKATRPEDRIERKWIHKPIAALEADVKTLSELQQRAQVVTTKLKTALRRK